MKVIHITVKPSATRDEVIELSPDTYQVCTPAPAKEGRANKEVIKLLARHLHISPASLIVSKGERWNEKTILWVE